eukprot:UN01937
MVLRVRYFRVMGWMKYREKVLENIKFIGRLNLVIIIILPYVIVMYGVLVVQFVVLVEIMSGLVHLMVYLRDF